MRKSQRVKVVNQFEEVLNSYSPMITAVLKKAKVYKNYQYYRHVATVALWEAWNKYNPSRGDFAPYAYRYMLTSIYTEMNLENRHKEHFICYEKEKIDVISQHKNKDLYVGAGDELFGKVLQLLNEEEMIFLYDLYVKGYTYQDLCEKTGVSVVALKKRRNRIMKKIRETFSHN